VNVVTFDSNKGRVEGETFHVHERELNWLGRQFVDVVREFNNFEELKRGIDDVRAGFGIENELNWQVVRERFAKYACLIIWRLVKVIIIGIQAFA
jgi:hypothetical protein